MEYAICHVTSEEKNKTNLGSIGSCIVEKSKPLCNNGSAEHFQLPSFYSVLCEYSCCSQCDSAFIFSVLKIQLFDKPVYYLVNLMLKNVELFL